jgi:hypothetical protein
LKSRNLYKSLKKYIKSLDNIIEAKKKEFLTYSFLLTTSYLQLYEKFFYYLFNESPLKPYINDDEGITWKYNLEHILRSQSNDLVGSFAVAGIMDYFFKPIFKEKSSLYSSTFSFVSLSSIEILQFFHLIPGVGDGGDILAYFMGSSLYFALSRSRKKEDNK